MLYGSGSDVVFMGGVDFPRGSIRRFGGMGMGRLGDGGAVIVSVRSKAFRCICCSSSIVLGQLLVCPCTRLAIMFIFVIVTFLTLTDAGGTRRGGI